MAAPPACWEISLQLRLLLSCADYLLESWIELLKQVSRARSCIPSILCHTKEGSRNLQKEQNIRCNVQLEHGQTSQEDTRHDLRDGGVKARWRLPNNGKERIRPSWGRGAQDKSGLGGARPGCTADSAQNKPSWWKTQASRSLLNDLGSALRIWAGWGKSLKWWAPPAKCLPAPSALFHSESTAMTHEKKKKKSQNTAVTSNGTLLSHPFWHPEPCQGHLYENESLYF